MTNEAPGGSTDPEFPGDRRKPLARYVEFGDDAIQSRFIAAAEDAYQQLVAADSFGGLDQIELRTGPPAPTRRGLFRRAAEPAPSQIVPTTAALARVATATSTIPGAVRSSPHGCTATSQVAKLLASVATDLVRDLIVLEPAEQAAHPAYRQTLRLAAELQGVGEIVAQVRCIDPNACVGIRSPERWGRRAEDVEVSEVRAVLLRLALAGRDLLDTEA